jgi:hypothetical protein
MFCGVYVYHEHRLEHTNLVFLQKILKSLLQYLVVFLRILIWLIWGCTALTVSVFVLCLHSVSESMSITVFSDTFLGRMIDAVVWEAVILSGPGLCVPWQHSLSSGSIGAGAYFWHSGPQPITLPSFTSF